MFKHWVTLTFAASAYLQVGEMAKAAIARDELLKVRPNFTIDFFDKFSFSQHPDYLKMNREILYPGLRLAGLPE